MGVVCMGWVCGGSIMVACLMGSLRSQRYESGDVFPDYGRYQGPAGEIFYRKRFINGRIVERNMGFKKTSDTIAISFGVTELAPGTFIQDEVALQLDVLNNEIFVVLGVDLDVSNPEAIAGVDTATRASVSSTSQLVVTNLSNTNCIVTAREAIRAAGFVDSGVGFARTADTSLPANLDYISLIATNNFFVQLQGSNNINPSNVAGRVWGYRAKADSATYAALVQSEVLSA